MLEPPTFLLARCISSRRLSATFPVQTSVVATFTTVTVTATGEVIGFLTNKGAGSYAGKLSWPVNPQNITVTSNLTGTASRAVTLK